MYVNYIWVKVEKNFCQKGSALFILLILSMFFLLLHSVFKVQFAALLQSWRMPNNCSLSGLSSSQNLYIFTLNIPTILYYNLTISFLFPPPTRLQNLNLPCRYCVLINAERTEAWRHSAASYNSFPNAREVLQSCSPQDSPSNKKEVIFLKFLICSRNIDATLLGSSLFLLIPLFYSRYYPYFMDRETDAWLG